MCCFRTSTPNPQGLLLLLLLLLQEDPSNAFAAYASNINQTFDSAHDFSERLALFKKTLEKIRKINSLNLTYLVSPSAMLCCAMPCCAAPCHAVLRKCCAVQALGCVQCAWLVTFHGS